MISQSGMVSCIVSKVSIGTPLKKMKVKVHLTQEQSLCHQSLLLHCLDLT
jgi:hypothetical protein